MKKFLMPFMEMYVENENSTLLPVRFAGWTNDIQIFFGLKLGNKKDNGVVDAEQLRSEIEVPEQSDFTLKLQCGGATSNSVWFSPSQNRKNYVVGGNRYNMATIAGLDTEANLLRRNHGEGNEYELVKTYSPDTVYQFYKKAIDPSRDMGCCWTTDRKNARKNMPHSIFVFRNDVWKVAGDADARVLSNDEWTKWSYVFVTDKVQLVDLATGKKKLIKH